MTKKDNSEARALDALLSRCFDGGERLQRELRLTPGQAAALAADYPADVRPLGGGWYDITFREAFSYGG